MGSWGITMRQSDYGLDLLGSIVEAQLKKVEFSTFNVAEAIGLLRRDILDEIKRANQGCPPGEAGLLHQRQFPARLHPGGASDCGVPCRLLPRRRADRYRIYRRGLYPRRSSYHEFHGHEG